MATFENSQILTREEELYSVFKEAEKPASQFRVGAEMEKIGVDAETGTPVKYDGDAGVAALMKDLGAREKWTEEREAEGGPLMALVKKGSSVTLEPGSQLELSGAAFETVHEVKRELDAHLVSIAPFSKKHNIKWLGLGFNPFAKRADYIFVPKQRYAVMKEYLPTKGSLALDMMLRTATVQANFDYSSESDAMSKMQVGLALSPLTMALFANSPFYEGAPFGGKSFRAKVWTDVDPDRSGLVPTLWKDGAKYTDYVEWALDIPMFTVKRDGKSVRNTEQTFRQFWKNGKDGIRATIGDWQTHLNTLFPDVRLKKTIEIRGADSQSSAIAPALPALYVGIFHDERALDETQALTDGWSLAEVTELRGRAWNEGLSGKFRGQKLVTLAERVIAIAKGGLERRARKNAAGADERIHLAALEALVSKGMTPADALLEGIEKAPDFRAEVIRRSSLV